MYRIVGFVRDGMGVAPVSVVDIGGISTRDMAEALARTLVKHGREISAIPRLVVFDPEGVDTKTTVLE